MKLWGVRFCVCGLMVHQSAQQLSCSKNDRCREGPHFSTQISCRNSASADFEKKLYVVHNCLAHCLYISRHSDNTSKGVKKQRLISIELIKKVCHNRYFLVSFLFYKRIYLLGLYHKYFIASTFKICSFSKLFYCP